MKSINPSLPAALTAALLFIAFPAALTAQPANWGPWQPCGDAVSVSFLEVTGTSVWTWRFRNDGPVPITYMDFYYTDNTGRNTDVLPSSMFKPGDILGGWAAFTANSLPTIQLNIIKWANSPAAPANGPSSQPQNNGSPSLPQNPPSPPLTPQQLAAQQQAALHIANAQADLAAAQNINAALLADTGGDASSAFRAELAPYGNWMELNGQSYWQPSLVAGVKPCLCVL
jgi:hypothetical protein